MPHPWILNSIRHPLVTSKNLKLLFVVVIICALCYGNAQRIRNLGDLGLAMDIIEHEYVDKPDKEKLYQAAMKGMIDSLDPYSGYIPVESLKPFQAVFEQEFGGLGVSLDGPKRRDRLTIVATLFDSPAYRAGIKPGDVILKINGEDSATAEVEDVSKKLRGREGTSVTLTIERANQPDPLEITVTRARIDVESVLGDRRQMDGKWDFIMQDDPRIAYMRLEIFGEKTTEELKRAIGSVRNQAQGLIIDLRDNTGGLLNAATDICDMFLDDGEVVSTRGRGDRVDQRYTAKLGTEIPNDIPIVVLINDHSASASEVVAACLQDRCRATIVGQRSFGKGSVQNVIPLDAGMAAMRLTTAYYYPPGGRLIHRRPKAKVEDTWGVYPDEGCEIKLDEEGFLKTIERFRKRSDPIKSGETVSNDSENQERTNSAAHADPTIDDDPQLMKAVEVLQSKMPSGKDSQPAVRK
jgi:carboxyl-terminal processing protease